MVEQISEVKSQREIFELIPYNEYKEINEKLQGNQDDSVDTSFVVYE